MVESPVLLVTFNRPDTTRKIYDTIRKAKPSKLYIFNDGPRFGNNEDLKAREEIIKITKEVDWQCDLFLNFSEKNLGCGLGVSGAISWAFENEDRLIILEDDTVPAMPFFSYCNILLEKYKDDTRICMISGNNYSADKNGTDDSYFFSKYGHIWGWATWKRAWDKFDYEIKNWPLFKSTNQLRNVFDIKKEQRFFANYFDNVFLQKEKTAWGPQWFYCRLREVGLSIVPQNNLVTNIGVQGVHTDKKTKAHFIPINENYKIIKDPQFILCNRYYDEYHFKLVIHQKQFLIIRIFRKSIRIIKSIFE